MVQRAKQLMVPGLDRGSLHSKDAQHFTLSTIAWHLSVHEGMQRLQIPKATREREMLDVVLSSRLMIYIRHAIYIQYR